MAGAAGSSYVLVGMVFGPVRYGPAHCGPVLAPAPPRVCADTIFIALAARMRSGRPARQGGIWYETGRYDKVKTRNYNDRYVLTKTGKKRPDRCFVHKVCLIKIVV